MNLAPSLSALETTDLIRLLNDADLAYLIKHALVQETAYGSLLKNERKRLHQLIGEALEYVYPDGRSENAARLAQHFGAAGDDAKLAVYAAWAGDDAARIYATGEAQRQYAAALDAALRIGAASPEIIELVTKLGRIYELADENERALETYARLSEVGVERNDPSCELAALMLQATLRAIPSSAFDPVQGQKVLDHALELARELNDTAAQAKILWNLLLLNGFTGRHDAAVMYGEQSLALARALKLKLQTAYTLNDLGNYGYYASGKPLLAEQAQAEARVLWRELDNLPMLSDNLNNSGIVQYLLGNFEKSQAFFDEALEVSERTENAWGIGLAHSLMGCLAYEAGDFGAALQELELANALTRAKNLGFVIVPATNLALLYASLGEFEAGLQVIQIAQGDVGVALYRAPSKAAFAYLSFLCGDMAQADVYIRKAQPRNAQELEFSYLPGILAQGEYYLAQGEPHTCLAVIQRIQDKLVSYGLRAHLADAELYLGHAFAMLGETANARAMFEQSEKSALEIGSRRSLLSAYRFWAQFERLQNQPELAQTLEDKAESLRSQIAATLPMQYRESFLQTNHAL